MTIPSFLFLCFFSPQFIEADTRLIESALARASPSLCCELTFAVLSSGRAPRLSRRMLVTWLISAVTSSVTGCQLEEVRSKVSSLCEGVSCLPAIDTE